MYINFPKNTQKILHFNWKVWTEFNGGHVVHASSLIRELRNFNYSQGYLFSGYTDGSKKVYLDIIGRQIDNIELFALLNTPGNINSDISKDIASPEIEGEVLDLVESFNPQLIHIHHMIGFNARLIEKLKETFKIPIIITLRDYWYVCPTVNLIDYTGKICVSDDNGNKCEKCIKQATRHPVRNSSGKNIVSRRNAFIDALNSADLVTTVSPYLKQYYISKGVYKEIIGFVQTGIPLKNNLKKKIRKGAAIKFAILGTMASHKGIGFILECLKRNPDANIELHLWGVVSDITMQNKLDSINDNRVLFNGPYDREKLGDILNDIDVGIVPSLWLDTAPQVIFEFFSQGIPILASNIGGIPNFVSHNVNGLLYDAYDINAFLRCLDRLISEPLLIERLSENVRPQKSTTEYAAEISFIYQMVMRSNFNSSPPL